MPYRRLPNTDLARIRAFNAAIQKGNELHPSKLAFSQSLYNRIRAFLPTFEMTVSTQKDKTKQYIDKNKHFQELTKKARLYLSHFTQVVNMAILRGELKNTIREFYEMSPDDSKVPQINTEQNLIIWGRKIIRGEEKRLATGATPITNPTIALVKVHFDSFVVEYQRQQNIKISLSQHKTKLDKLRNQADEIILDLWNQIENSFKNLNTEQMRTECTNYGVKYVYRKNEKQQPFLNINYGKVS